MNPRRQIAIHLPDHLPIVAALLTAVLVAAYILASAIAELRLGRPSSTAGLGIVVAPIAGLLCGAAAFAIGIGLRGIARRVAPSRVIVPMWLGGCVLLLTVGAVVFLARTQVVAKEFAQRPRVIVTSKRVVKMSEPPALAFASVQAPLLFSIYGDEVVPSIDWNGRPVSLIGTDERVAVLDAVGADLASTDLHGFNSVGRVSATPFCQDPDGGRDLAVLVTLRATSHRSMLVLYGVDGAVIYQEHLERYGVATSMSVVNHDGNEVLVVHHGAVTALRCSAG